MELGDLILLLATLAVFIYGLLSESSSPRSAATQAEEGCPTCGCALLSSTESYGHTPGAQQLREPEGLSSKSSQESRDGHGSEEELDQERSPASDLVTSRPTDKASPKAVDVIYLPMAPVVLARQLQEISDAIPRRGYDADATHSRAGRFSAPVQPHEEEEEESASSCCPFVSPFATAPVLASHLEADATRWRQLWSGTTALSKPGTGYRPCSPTSPRSTTLRQVACIPAAAAVAFQPLPGGSPITTIAMPAPLAVQTPLCETSQGGARPDSHTFDSNSCDGTSSSCSSSGQAGDAGALAPKGAPETRLGNPHSPVSVLLRTIEFDGQPRGSHGPCRSPAMAAACQDPSTPKLLLGSPSTVGWGPSSSGAGGCATDTGTSSKSSACVSVSAAAKGAAYHHNVRYASISPVSGGGLLRSPLRTPASPGFGSAFGSSTGGSLAAAPSFLALARASQSRALASPSSPATPSPVPAKRLAKPNMPRIAGL